MSIQDYVQGDYDSVITLWISCGLIKGAGQATKEQLSGFCEKGTFLIYKEHSKGIIGTVLGTWDGWRGWIYKLAVAETDRRKGIGTQLLAEITRRLRRDGATIIRAYIETNNTASLTLFEKNGYEQMDDFVILTKGRQ
jgi:ribosomal protein S18 acetylase RimI-like enzyme